MIINKYEGRVELFPKQNELRCNLTLNYKVKEDNTDYLELYLYHNFFIDEIKSNQMKSYYYDEQITNWSPFVSESKLLKINFDKSYMIGDEVTIHFSYHGKVDIVSKWEINRLNEDFIELGLYAPWFPLTKMLELAKFSFEVILPKSYQLVNGKLKDGIWKLNQDYPSYDCSLIASNHFKSYNNYSNIAIYYLNENYSSFTKKVNEKSKWIIDYYSKIFSKMKVENTNSIVFLSRKIGGAYCRPGLIVFSEPVDETMDISIQFLAHELGHLWWNKSCNTQSYEDWLNEAFAEYSSLMVVREKLGYEKFEQRIIKYKEKIIDLPPIYGIKREDEKSHLVLYIKGAIILYQLEKEIGEERFINFLRNVHKKSINNTLELINLLEKLEGKKIADNFRLALKK